LLRLGNERAGAVVRCPEPLVWKGCHAMTYTTIEDAVAAYAAGAQKYHTRNPVSGATA